MSAQLAMVAVEMKGREDLKGDSRTVTGLGGALSMGVTEVKCVWHALFKRLTGADQAADRC